MRNAWRETEFNRSKLRAINIVRDTRAGKLRQAAHVTVNIRPRQRVTRLETFSREVTRIKRANILTRALSRDKGKGDPCSELQAWKPYYCVLGNGKAVGKTEENRSDKMKEIICTFDVLFLAVSSTLDESSSTSRSRRRRVSTETGHRLERVLHNDWTSSSIVDNAKPKSHRFHTSSPLDDIRPTIHEIPPSFVPSRFCLFLRNFRASVREARVKNEPSYRGYGRLCAIDVVPTALSAAAPRDWRGRRSCHTFSKERLCRYYPRTCFDNIRIYVYTVIDTGLPHLAQIIGVPLYDRAWSISSIACVYASSFSVSRNFLSTRNTGNTVLKLNNIYLTLRFRFLPWC